ncbi:zinc finger protein DZIP1 [Drosophila willistoni]|uniref:zinc finger protein DZIP1 n=1 Tax=Drosophila willistoni TaxID=7260 RepID=UPI00017D8FE2|nr:zinc finger protein DZIP1 [Drosophila willistoni]
MGYQDKITDFPQMVREAGFKLRQYRDGPLDWRQMGSYETERILREQNFEMVDKALTHLSEAPLGTVLETHILDSGIAKYFVMSQYAIQYLLCCRTYLNELVVDLREAHSVAQIDIANLRKSLTDSNHEVVQLHKKITQIETIREVVYPCHLCTKNFISNESLNIHIGRKHRVGSPPSLSQSGGVKEKDKCRDNDMHLINTIKMELEIKQLKERLNAAERNIKERGSKHLGATSTTADNSSPRMDQRTVGIQSNLVEEKEKEDLKSEMTELDTSPERKERLHGLAEKLQHFETWQMQLKQSNEQFVQDINKKLEDLSHALEQNKQAITTDAASPSTEERLGTPRLEDLERILTEKVTEIGKVSANKLEEVVHHLEMGYKDKLDALERELKQINTRRLSNEPESKLEPVALVTNVSKIPKPIVNRRENSLEHIKNQVEQEFVEKKRDDDTYSIEELPKPLVTQVQVQVHEAKQPIVESLTANQSNKEIQQTSDSTDISESLSHEDDDKAEGQSPSEEDSEVLTSDRESFEEILKKPSPIINPAFKMSPPKAMTRKDMRKLVNRKLSSHGFDMKSKQISHTSMKKLNMELAENRNKLKLQYPNFYATRNRIRKFVEKLCSAKLPQHAEVLLKHKTPLQPIEVPKRRAKNQRAVTTDEDNLEKQPDEKDDSASSSSRSTSPPRRQVSHDFKAHLDQILVKPVAAVASKSSLSASGNANPSPNVRPVPLPRKRVMFNTLSSGKSFNEHDEN